VVPNVIDLVLVFDELKIPVFNTAEFSNIKDPAVNVYVPVAASVTVWLFLIVTVPAVCVNNGMADIVPPLNVNDPEVNTMLVVAVIEPLSKLTVAPLTVYVVQVFMYTALLYQVPPVCVNAPVSANCPYPLKLPLAQNLHSSVPEVKVNVVAQHTAYIKLVVPE